MKRLTILAVLALAGCGLMREDPAHRRRNFVRSCINSEGPAMEPQCEAGARKLYPRDKP